MTLVGRIWSSYIKHLNKHRNRKRANLIAEVLGNNKWTYKEIHLPVQAKLRCNSSWGSYFFNPPLNRMQVNIEWYSIIFTERLWCCWGSGFRSRYGKRWRTYYKWCINHAAHWDLRFWFLFFAQYGIAVTTFPQFAKAKPTEP